MDIPTTLTATPGTARQGEIYLHGMLHQKREAIPTRQADLEAAAEAKMSPEAFAYVAGSAGREATATANRTAFDRRRIVPRMLRDVGNRRWSPRSACRNSPTRTATSPPPAPVRPPTRP
jgi:lactate 2-monooxygenase